MIPLPDQTESNKYRQFADDGDYEVIDFIERTTERKVEMRGRALARAYKHLHNNKRGIALDQIEREIYDEERRLLLKTDTHGRRIYDPKKFFWNIVEEIAERKKISVSDVKMYLDRIEQKTIIYELVTYLEDPGIGYSLSGPGVRHSSPMPGAE